jgi:DNA-binding GntR family transcriptional regulator
MASATALQDLAPIERPTLGSQAYFDLRKLIMSGRLAPGDRLPLRSVANALGVSIMPVRDAINRLVAEQALVMTPSRAVRVPVMTPAEFQELATIRAVLEGFAAEQAALHRSKDDVKQIVLAEQTYRDECLQRLADPAKALLFNMNFHFAVYRAAKLPKLLEMIESLWLRVGPVFIVEVRSSPDRLSTGGAHLHHRRAVTAIKAGDGEAAREALANDIRSAAAYILTRTQFGVAAGDQNVKPAAATSPIKSSSTRQLRRTLDR